MTGISSVGEWRNRHWENEESTSAILKRDTGVEIHGNDKSWRETKTEQKNHVGGLGAAEVTVVGAEGAEVAGASLGAGLTIALPVISVGLNFYGLHEAIKNGAEQSSAITKDDAHVALVAVLDLPGRAKEAAYAERCETARGPSSNADKMANRIMKDPAGLAVVQAHCDRGIISAFASVPIPQPTNLSLKDFLSAPSRAALKQICDEDPAFMAGFEAFFNGSPSERTQMLAGVEKRDLRASNGVHIGG